MKISQVFVTLWDVISIAKLLFGILRVKINGSRQNRYKWIWIYNTQCRKAVLIIRNYNISRKQGQLSFILGFSNVQKILEIMISSMVTVCQIVPKSAVKSKPTISRFTMYRCLHVVAVRHSIRLCGNSLTGMHISFAFPF